jgi:hypothetical protein
MNFLQFQTLQGPQTFVTDNYVSSPPALIIVDESGAVWTLGFNRGAPPSGEFAFDVLRDGVSVGEFASRIERRAGRIRCFTRDGWKIWNGHSFF